MIATASQSRSTSSSWWLEKITGMPLAARSASTPASTSTPTGSRPENGSSSTSTAASCTPLLVAERQLLHPVAGPLGHAQALDPVAGGVRRRRGREPVQAGEVLQLVADPHLRVQAALLGHVCGAFADPVRHRCLRHQTWPAAGSSTPRMM